MLTGTRKIDGGFTLIEVMIALVVLTVGILALYTMQVTAIRGNMRANLITLASTWNEDQLETIIGMKYSDTRLVDADGDGTSQDLNWDGVDDDGGNFGLDDVTAATADGNTTSPGGRYVIYWNVAVGTPMPNLKTIYVFVQDLNQILSRPVSFVYIKDDII